MFAIYYGKENFSCNVQVKEIRYLVTVAVPPSILLFYQTVWCNPLFTTRAWQVCVRDVTSVPLYAGHTPGETLQECDVTRNIVHQILHSRESDSNGKQDFVQNKPYRCNRKIFITILNFCIHYNMQIILSCISEKNAIYNI